MVSVARSSRVRAAPASAAFAGAAAGAGAWCSLGALDWIAGGRPIRVAMLPPLIELPVLILVGAAAAIGAAIWLERRAGGRNSTYGRDALLPLAVLVSLTIPYLPFAGELAPGLTVLAGPIKTLAWAIVLLFVGLIVAQFLAPRPPRGVMPSTAFVFLAGALICGGVGFRQATVGLHPGGDEPHYLVIAQSVWRDGDLQIANNHERRDYREYFDADLAPHYLKPGTNGQIYSVHPIGLPIVIAPVYALGGYGGVVFFLTMVGAAAAALMWRHARRVAGDRSALFAWAALCISVPFCLNSLTVYPEILAGLAVMIALSGIVDDDRKWWRMLTCGVALSTLPWLSTKYAPMTAAIAVLTVLRLLSMSELSGRNRVRLSMWVMTPLVLSLAGWFLFFYTIWGTVSPSAPYGGSTTTTARYAMSGFPGLLLDQEYGVVIYAPVLLVGMAGVWSMWRTGGGVRRLAVELTLVFCALLVTVGAFHVWWGGSAVPGRPIASGLLLFGIPIAWQHARTDAAGRAIHWLLLISTAAITAVILAVQRGLLTANGRDGSSRLLEWLSPDWPLWAVFPSFIVQRPAAALALTAAWVVVLAGCWKLAHLPFRRVDHAALPGEVEPAVFQISTAGRKGCAAMVSALVAYTIMSFAGPTIRAASIAMDDLDTRPRSALLDRYDAAKRPLAIVYDRFRRVPADAVPPLFRFVARPDSSRPRTQVPLLFNARFALPAGKYRVSLETSEPSAGWLAVQMGRDAPAPVTWPVDGRSGSYEFDLGVDVNFVGFRTSPELERRVRAIRIQPIQLVDAHLRPSSGEVLGVFQRPAATLYFYDRNVWIEPDGFWTRGASATSVTVVPRAGHTLPLRIRCGPRPNTFTLDTGEWQGVEHVPPGTEKHVAMPFSRGGAVTELRLTTEAGFTPAAVEPGNRDRRFLGCRVEL